MSQPLSALVEKGSAYLAERGFGEKEAKGEVERLLLHCLGISKSEWCQYRENPSFIDDSMERDFLSLLEKRASRMPLQYLEGEAAFMDFSFRVSPDVLIPRPETENLVEKVLETFKGRENEPLRILDVGTGSGCILLSLLRYFPHASGVGTDLSERALRVAVQNARALDVEERVSFRLEKLLDDLARDRFDLIVSNPPYVSSAEWESLSEEVKREPREALVAGPTGLECYVRMIPLAQQFLRPGGHLFFEVGWTQADCVVELLEQAGFREVQKFHDDCGIERIVTGESQGWIKSSSTAADA